MTIAIVLSGDQIKKNNPHLPEHIDEIAIVTMINPDQNFYPGTFYLMYLSDCRQTFSVGIGSGEILFYL
jgi:hypothetical protein